MTLKIALSIISFLLFFIFVSCLISLIVKKGKQRHQTNGLKMKNNKQLKKLLLLIAISFIGTFITYACLFE